MSLSTDLQQYVVPAHAIQILKQQYDTWETADELGKHESCMPESGWIWP